MPDSRFPIVAVTLHADSLISEVTHDIITHTTAPADIAGHTYAALCESRQRLYEYIKTLEQRAGLQNDGVNLVIRRFT